MTRTAGVLLHLTSLPGPFGCGKIGPEALEFARLIKAVGCAFWQVLPFGPPAAGHSPYQCDSVFAGNPLLIDPRPLAISGLLTEDEVLACHLPDAGHQCDFSGLELVTARMLRQAYGRLSSELAGRIEFWRQSPDQAFWLEDYAVYRTIRLQQANKPWWEWPDNGLKWHDPAALAAFCVQNQTEIFFQVFVQYWFFQQWLALKGEINRIGIQVIGDMPIYVALDSCDVWANRQYFDLDESGRPLQVAGVPPDYFARDGQLWGNPLYLWPNHEADGFVWWLERLASALRLFDRVRLDHFRGFVNYWAVPAEAATAKSGKWLSGPEHQLFGRFFERFAKSAIIAEDLGEIDDEVRQFLQETGLPGMRVLQFGFDPAVSSTHLPCFYPANCVAFSGTHDNNTLLGWLWAAGEAERSFALNYAGLTDPTCDWGRGGRAAPAVCALLRVLWASAADLVISPLQDLLGYGRDARMNTPGEAAGQWGFRVTASELDGLDLEWLEEINRTYRRHTDYLLPGKPV